MICGREWSWHIKTPKNYYPTGNMWRIHKTVSYNTFVLFFTANGHKIGIYLSQKRLEVLS